MFQYDVLAMLALGVFALSLIQRSFWSFRLCCAITPVLAQDVVEKIGDNSGEKCGKPVNFLWSNEIGYRVPGRFSLLLLETEEPDPFV